MLHNLRSFSFRVISSIIGFVGGELGANIISLSTFVVFTFTNLLNNSASFFKLLIFFCLSFNLSSSGLIVCISFLVDVSLIRFTCSKSFCSSLLCGTATLSPVFVSTFLNFALLLVIEDEDSCLSNFCDSLFFFSI